MEWYADQWRQANTDGDSLEPEQAQEAMIFLTVHIFALLPLVGGVAMLMGVE